MELFKLLAFGLRSEISYLAYYLWSDWASAIAKIHINVALGIGPKMRSGTGQRGACMNGFPSSIIKTLWAAMGLELCS